MPCDHGYIFWWDCPECKEDEEIRKRNTELALRETAAKRQVETLEELKAIRSLLESGRSK